MQTEQNQSNTIAEILKALSKTQGKLESALKDKENPFFKSKYADLSSIWSVCRQPLSENELSIIQTIEGTKTDMFLVTILGHSSGEWIKSKLPLIIQKQDAQGVGSAISYARRYALSAMIGVCQEDDDGERSISRKTENQRTESPKVDKPKKEEVDHLISLISQCPQKHQDKVKNFMENKNIKSLYDINKVSYEHIHRGTLEELSKTRNGE
jgi:hypothetical protein